jgi:5-methylcytosine-specific restriction protein A
MKTFLLTWNPAKWNWIELDRNIEQVEASGTIGLEWSIVSHRKMRRGDRVFLMRLGEEPRGIMASGFVVSQPFTSKHWNGDDKLTHRVAIEFEVIINPSSGSILELESLSTGSLSEVNWTPQSSGTEIKPAIANELEKIWLNFLSANECLQTPSIRFEDPKEELLEGVPNQVVVTRYERNPYAREICIEHHGMTCAICGFNFEKVYGALGKGFIHVHHLKKIASVGEEYRVDPIKDLRPVCPNCHAMIHRRKEPYSVKEIESTIKNTAS